MSREPWSAATAGVWANQMGQLGSDPGDGDVWTPCSACSRPTRMTGTKLCDRCWELNRNRAGLPIDSARQLANIQKDAQEGIARLIREGQIDREDGDEVFP